MLSPADLETLRAAVSTRASPALFAWFGRAGLAGHGVVLSLGGRPGTIADLAGAVIDLAAVSVEAAEALVAHRLCIELMVCARNIGLRDYLLPQLLAGERAGAWPARAMRTLAAGSPELATGTDTDGAFG
jgi:hypothetical protein